MEQGEQNELLRPEATETVTEITATGFERVKLEGNLTSFGHKWEIERRKRGGLPPPLVGIVNRGVQKTVNWKKTVKVDVLM
jgi:hypothetical protein